MRDVIFQNALSDASRAYKSDFGQIASEEKSKKTDACRARTELTAGSTDLKRENQDENDSSPPSLKTQKLERVARQLPIECEPAAAKADRPVGRLAEKLRALPNSC